MCSDHNGHHRTDRTFLSNISGAYRIELERLDYELGGRRLHHLFGLFRTFQADVPAASPLAPRATGSLRSSNRMAASNAAGLRCM